MMTKRIKAPIDRGATFQLREPRFTIDMRTRLTTFDKEDVEIRLLNISSNGLFGLSSQPLQIGSTVMIDLQTLGTAAAQVRWALGRRFGAAFLKELKLDETLVSELTEKQ